MIEVFTLHEGTYRQHARGIGAEKVTSNLLPELVASFEQLEV